MEEDSIGMDKETQKLRNIYIYIYTSIPLSPLILIRLAKRAHLLVYVLFTFSLSFAFY